MPTSYTYKVKEGEITSLKDYAMECARAFGALIHMRDSDPGEKIPDTIPLEPYYYDTILEAQKELVEYVYVDGDEERDYHKQCKLVDDYENEKKLARARYDTMLEKVRVWDCKVEGIKEFMIEQLETSIKCDCSDWAMPTTVKLSAEEYKAKELERLANNVARASSEYEKAVKRNNERNKWLRELRACIE